MQHIYAGTENSIKHRYGEAQSFPDFLDTAEANPELWRAVYDRARVPDDLAERAQALPGKWHLLILSADWCGDAVNTVPVVIRLAEVAPNVDIRLLDRDENLDLMDAHLTNGSRSIPVVMVFDEQWRERGWWGPRPRELQRWVMEEGKALPKAERYREVRRWYARDRGRTTIEEVLAVLENAAVAEAA